ncbi:hypothetical protein [Microbacterium sp.]|uniref:hypothetical protein n=1 Tax=Microbacterium sp. TaxID=51671 RepID=UPI0039E5CBC4
MINLTPLEEAAWVYEHQVNYTRQQRYDAVASLWGWGIFSAMHVGAIVGISHTTVYKLTAPRETRMRGKFDPACLAGLLKLRNAHARGERVSAEDVTAMLDAGQGTSVMFAARLSGIPDWWLRRRYRKEEK